MDDSVIVDLLGQVGNLFTSSLELKETIDFMLKAASDIVVCDAATVFLLDGDGSTLHAIATFPFAESVDQVARFELGEGIVGWAAQERKVVAVPDATKDQRFKSLNLAYSPRSCLVMPLQSPGKLIGALTLARRKVNPFTNVEQAMMQIIANQAAISIDNARLYNEQKRQFDEIAAQKRDLEMANRQIGAISRLKSEFLASMSHELRTPLNAILGFSEIVKDNLVELSDEQRQECLESIHASGKHLLELVNDVLDLSKIEAGRMELSYETFALHGAVREVINVVRSLSERRQLDLELTVTPEHLMVRADKSKVKQIMYNFLSNAIKFTEAGGRVWVKAYAEDSDIVIEVGDTGVGIAEDDYVRIFSEFYQVDNPLTREEQGTGLGLSLTRRLIQLHGGGVSVKSEMGKGSVFTFHLPAGGIEAADEEPRRRVLLVEDNRASRDLVTLILSNKGFDVDVAVDGNEGLQKAKARIYDLILMDIQLPGIDGVTLTRLIKSDPRTADVPIVALSANAMKGDEQKALAAGCAGYIYKPINVADFVERISHYLEAGAQ